MIIDDIVQWFGGTSDFWGVVVGSAVGVVFGYLASVVHQIWDAKRDRQNVRALIRQEYLLNLRTIRHLRSTSREFKFDPESHLHEDAQIGQFHRHKGRVFAYGPRPFWSRAALSAHLQRFPDVLADGESEQILTFYHGLDGISAYWDRLHSALVIDLNAPTQKEVEFVFQRHLVPNNPHEFNDTVDQVWPKLEKLMADLSQSPDTILR